MSEYVEINVDKLRKDLEECFGTAMFVASPLAMFDLEKVENASVEKLILIAQSCGFDINKYIR